MDKPEPFLGTGILWRCGLHYDSLIFVANCYPMECRYYTSDSV